MPLDSSKKLIKTLEIQEMVMMIKVRKHCLNLQQTGRAGKTCLKRSKAKSLEARTRMYSAVFAQAGLVMEKLVMGWNTYMNL